MESGGAKQSSQMLENVCFFIRKCIVLLLSAAPVPSHVAFIMDGNRRYAKKLSLEEGHGHRAGHSALMSMLKYCYEFGVKYVTIYAFSIDNFKRSPEEVGSLMHLMQEKIEELIKEDTTVNRYGIRVYFKGNLDLLSDSVRSAAERAMVATARNSKATLSICVAYTSTDEIVHAVEQSCEEKWYRINGKSLNSSQNYKHLNGSDKVDSLIAITDVDRNMYMADVPDPDIIIRASGETRLSNFLLWQSAKSLLYSPDSLWPEIGFRHLVWAILNFQRNARYLKDAKEKET
ncbi:hypothetical protein DM860_002673 [Cuscuta australis]|uniref:Alkyl transferase n=1 Tax=Cuscuta australis TaxID=267555 RepID=A0A328CZ05_9ASTE|nr:hypothetical protein DM860_002673 [Cuscuta australis]